MTYGSLPCGVQLAIDGLVSDHRIAELVPRGEANTMRLTARLVAVAALGWAMQGTADREEVDGW